MSAEMIALNNKILKLEGFINDITFSTEGNNLIVSASVAHEKNRASQQNYNPAYTIEKSGHNGIIPKAKTAHTALYNNITQSFFEKSHYLDARMAALKAAQAKANNLEASYEAYIAVLQVLSHGSMTNKKGQTPREYMEEQNTSNVNFAYMIPLFEDLKAYEATLQQAYQPNITVEPAKPSKLLINMVCGIPFILLIAATVLSAIPSVPTSVTTWVLFGFFVSTLGSLPAVYWMNRLREDVDLPFFYGSDSPKPPHDDYERLVDPSRPGVYNLFELKSPVAAAESGGSGDVTLNPSNTPSLHT